MTDTCPSVGRHGDLTSYWQDGCRCPDASRQATRRAKQYRAGVRRMTDATGTRRRLRALAAIGWRQTDLAARLGVTQKAIAELATTSRQQVRTSTAVKVAALYQQLHTQPGPSQRAAATARNRGWLGPEWWDDTTLDDPTADPTCSTARPARAHDDIDPVAVDRACAGEHLTLTPAERREVVRRLTAQGRSARQIAPLAGMTLRTVVRIRSAHEQQVAS